MNDDPTLYEWLVIADADGYTTNMEYTTPDFRIVLPYQTEELVILNLRHRETGELLVGEELLQKYPILHSHSVFTSGEIDSTFPMRNTLKESIEEVYKMKDIEGFVVQLKDGTMFKIKTEWYCALHFTRDSIMVDSRLYKAVLEGGSDDLRQLFSTDPFCIEKIEKMENLIFMCYNTLVSDVENFYEDNKHLDRKAYAKAVTTELPNTLCRQGHAFALYNGKTPEYKETLLKYMKDVLQEQ
jgi:T4 RnlA family RNA ligase